MIPQKMLPPALRTAPVEEQLSYLLQRRRTIENLMQSLETYTKERGDAAQRAAPRTAAAA